MVFFYIKVCRACAYFGYFVENRQVFLCQQFFEKNKTVIELVTLVEKINRLKNKHK